MRRTGGGGGGGGLTFSRSAAEGGAPAVFGGISVRCSQLDEASAIFQKRMPTGRSPAAATWGRGGEGERGRGREGEKW